MALRKKKDHRQKTTIKKTAAFANVMRRSSRGRDASPAGSSSRWSSASRDSSERPTKHLTFASSSSENEETDDDQSNLL